MKQDIKDIGLGVRKVALTLHGLGPADRAWLLSRLEPQDREALQPLLEELDELGIPQDVELVEQALLASAQRPTLTDDIFGPYSPQAAWAAVESEPNEVQVRCFAALTVDERREILPAVVQAGPAQRLREAMNAPPLAPALRNALRHSWGSAMARRAGESVGVPGASG